MSRMLDGNRPVGQCTIGTTGKAQALEAFNVNVNDGERSGSVVYQAHVANIGWQSEVSDGATAGTTGRSLAVQAVRMKLTGELEQAYDLYYRVHSATFGWLDWTCKDALGNPSCNWLPRRRRSRVLRRVRPPLDLRISRTAISLARTRQA